MKKRQRLLQKDSSEKIDYKKLAFRLVEWLRANKGDCHIVQMPSCIIPTATIVEVRKDYTDTNCCWCGGFGIGEQSAYKNMLYDFFNNEDLEICQLASTPNVLNVYLAANGF